MATVTHTASLAQSNYVPLSNIGTNLISGVVGPITLSASGSGMILLAKIPPNAKVTILEAHTSGATTQVLNLGVRSGRNTSLTASALGGTGAAQGAANLSIPYQCVRDETDGEMFKYVIATLQSGSVTASFQINYQITYTSPGSPT